MIPLLLFPVLAAGVVWLAGRRDPARDPRLTTLSLCLLALFPLLMLLLLSLTLLLLLEMGLSTLLGLWALCTLRARCTLKSRDTWRSPWLLHLGLVWVSGIGPHVAALGCLRHQRD
jgi:hypothetical protein